MRTFSSGPLYFKSLCGGERRLTLAWWDTETAADKFKETLQHDLLLCSLHSWG